MLPLGVPGKMCFFVLGVDTYKRGELGGVQKAQEAGRGATEGTSGSTEGEKRAVSVRIV